MDLFAPVRPLPWIPQTFAPRPPFHAHSLGASALEWVLFDYSRGRHGGDLAAPNSPTGTEEAPRGFLFSASKDSTIRAWSEVCARACSTPVGLTRIIFASRIGGDIQGLWARVEFSKLRP